MPASSATAATAATAAAAAAPAVTPQAVASDVLLGGKTFFAAPHPSGKDVGSNGLPLTPNSIRIYGRFQNVLSLQHRHLCAYLGISRGKHERLFVISEIRGRSLEDYLQRDGPRLADRPRFPDLLRRIAYQVLDGLAYLADRGIVHRSLAAENVMLEEGSEDVRLADYGMFSMTNGGREVNFPIGHPRYMAPEVVAAGPRPSANAAASSPKGDVWSAGIVLVEQVLGRPAWGHMRGDLGGVCRRIVALGSVDAEAEGALRQILAEHRSDVEALPPGLRQFLAVVLRAHPSARPCAGVLLLHDYLAPVRLPEADAPAFGSAHMAMQAAKSSQERRAGWATRPKALSAALHVRTLAGATGPAEGVTVAQTLALLRAAEQQASAAPPTRADAPAAEGHALAGSARDDFVAMSMREVYLFWTLAGGDVAVEMGRLGLVHSRSPILLMPHLVLRSGRVVGETRDRTHMYESRFAPLPLEKLRQRLADMDKDAVLLLSTSVLHTKDTADLPHHDAALESARIQRVVEAMKQTRQLPLVIRERDIEYQLMRVLLISNILDGCPYLLGRMMDEAKADIPPYLRGRTWAVLLNVQGDYQSFYESIDKDSETATDRQIEVDIPRCHQYHTALSSPEGHARLKRVLKAWVAHNKDTLVYWQGLDSLAATFISVNFQDEALAFACMERFIAKYLTNFFLPSNTLVIQEYLAVFRHVIAFHDAELANHIDEMGFLPDLYAIPWFLTMFTHVFPLDKIYYLWDSLLLLNNGIPLVFGVAILRQFRDEILGFGFNECILLFSDMPDVDIEKVVRTGMSLADNTPPSILHRVHGAEMDSKNGAQAAEEEEAPASTGGNTAPGADKKGSKWWERPLPLEGLKQEVAPRIALADAIALDSRVIVLDCRPVEDFCRVHWRGALHTTTQRLKPLSSLLKPYRDGFFVICGSRNKDAPQFAAVMVKLQFNHVAVLKGGIDVLEDAARTNAEIVCACGGHNPDVERKNAFTQCKLYRPPPVAK